MTRTKILMRFILVAVLVGALSSCTWVTDDEEECQTIEEVLTELPMVSVTLNATLPADYSTYKIISRAETTYTLRYVVEIYPYSGTSYTRTAYKRIVTTEWPLTLELPATKYHVNIWADYTTDGESDLYYCADTFSEITLNGSYAGNNTAKDAFFSSETLDLSDLDLNYMDFELERPVARWILLQYPYDSTSDEAANFSYNIVTYSGFTPCAFNLFTSKPNDATGGLNFLAYKVTDIMPNTDYADELGDDEYLLLAYDYVFADSDTTTVTVVVYTYNKAGEIIVTSSAFDITLVRGKQTIIKGDFITPSSSGDGIGINPEMYGDYNIEFS